MSGFIYEKMQVVSTIYKLFQYNFWQNYLEFSNKMRLTVRMIKLTAILYIVTQFVRTDRCFASLIILELESKFNISSTIKENLLLYSRKASAFVIAVIVYDILMVKHTQTICR